MAAKQELYAPQEPKGTGDRRNLSVKPQPDQYEDKELTTLYAKIRAGVDPDTGELHMTEDEFVAAITEKRLEARAKGRIDELELVLNHDLHEPLAGPCRDDCVEKMAEMRLEVCKKGLAELTKQEGKR